MMQSFTSSDGLVLKYFDSGIVSGDEAQGVSGQVKGDEKPWLIFVSGVTFVSASALVVSFFL